MTTAIALPNDIIIQDAPENQVDALWWRVFDTRKAVQQVDSKMKTLGSDRNEIQSSRQSYEAGLLYFLNWAGPRLPDEERRGYTVYEFIVAYPAHRFPGEELVTDYIGHLNERGLARSTIMSKYLTPLKHYVRALHRQALPVRGEARDFVLDCKEQLQNVLDIDVPAQQSSGNISPLYAHGNRLSVAQVDAVFGSVADETLIAMRDLALLYVGFNAALRVAELQRMTLSSLVLTDSGWTIRVRGKRNNWQPVPLDANGYWLIMRWVEAYNAGLDEDDPRRIGATGKRVNRRGEVETVEVPIWQPLRRGGNRYEMGDGRFDPLAGMQVTSLRDMVTRRVKAVLGIVITPHDMRRTAAAIARKNGYDYDVIQLLLRHADISTTKNYVGPSVDLHQALLSNVVSWSLPSKTAA